MRNKLAVLAYLFFGAVGSTHAQAGGVKVRVPFQFSVGDKVLSAGEYVIWPDHNLVLLRAADGKIAATAQANHGEPDGGKSAKVIFHCYQKQCYFSGFWNPENEIARETPRSKAETELAKHGEIQVFALLGETLSRSR